MHIRQAYFFLATPHVRPFWASAAAGGAHDLHVPCAPEEGRAGGRLGGLGTGGEAASFTGGSTGKRKSRSAGGPDFPLGRKSSSVFLLEKNTCSICTGRNTECFCFGKSTGLSLTTPECPAAVSPSPTRATQAQPGGPMS